MQLTFFDSKQSKIQIERSPSSREEQIQALTIGPFVNIFFNEMKRLAITFHFQSASNESFNDDSITYIHSGLFLHFNNGKTEKYKKRETKTLNFGCSWYNTN